MVLPLPYATPLDSIEESPVPIDPLGTLPLAERLAEELLPGVTGRMWRVRLLTFSAVASHVATVVAAGREDRFLEARLVFERLFVMAQLRHKEPDVEDAARAARSPALRRLPGVGLARAARRVGVGLSRSNFLSGQAVNGPFGVMARLARGRKVLDSDDRLGGPGEKLLEQWSREQGLDGFLGESANGEPGRKWASDVVRAVSANLEKKEWPGPKSGLWEQIARPLDLAEGMGKGERRALLELLGEGPLGFVATLKELGSTEGYRAFLRRRRERGRGVAEREFLEKVVSKGLEGGDIGAHVRRVLKLIRHFEGLAAAWQDGFDALLRGLRSEGGQARAAVVIARASTPLVDAAGRAQGIARSIVDEGLHTEVPDFAPAAGPLLDASRDATLTAEDMAARVLKRHVEVQRARKRSPWIDAGDVWSLVRAPGESEDAEGGSGQERSYMHAFRITNVYSMLADLGLVRWEDADGQA
ncbi:MAG: hypothetical protein KJ067_20840 [Vicinamibacteria bacterium]|nr:hypothetical protein [Vicinamibacteria bacterium]